MDAEQFREFAKATVDYVADYLENIRDRPVLPDVTPGFMSKLLPSEAPYEPDTWQDVIHDVEHVIMPGVTHWQSPSFHAFYPTSLSYPAIVGEILSAAISGVGFSWIANPASTELEVIVIDWLGKMLGLPSEFLPSSDGPGGGVIQGSASEATLIGLLAARETAVRKAKALNPHLNEAELRGKFVAYSSNQSNSSVEKAGLLAAVPMKLLPSDNKCRMRGNTLLKQIREDRANGLIPIYVVATFGTTGTCAFDPADELGPICNEEGIWLHIDAAYAGAALVCPEFRHLMSGIHYADSFNFNPHKWMLTNFDCSAMWLKDATELSKSFCVERIYLEHKMQGKKPDYRHWQIPLGRRFRALKLWFVLRLYGIRGIQDIIRKHVQLAKYFETLVRADPRFEIPCDQSMGVVCFRLKGPDELTRDLVAQLTARRNIYLIAATVNEQIAARFVVCSTVTEEKDIVKSWQEILYVANKILDSNADDMSVKIVEKV
ncbi:aromatic-L-amino-acid decarboxylase-like [Schistocerca cancellata]|uniref:aromatic-L-amino-acid decarboxylase-like n=1 Tax=Schistocerca cancellata TaxID=274614 RepID=UPI0021179BEE|nr:aromatic-L-amino-acid decarboxylase-like [Schistocerca cancellata]